MNWTSKRTQDGSLSDLFIINLEQCWNQLSVSCREVVRCNQSSSLLHWKFSLDMGVNQWRIQGEGPGGLDPPFPPTDLTLVWDWNCYYGRIIYHFLTRWFLLMKCVLHFATKLNSRDIQKCNLLFLGTLLWSARLCLQSNNSCTNGDWRSQIEKHVVVSAFSAGHEKNSPSWTKVWTPPPPLPLPPPIKNSWICPCNQLATHIRSDQVRSFCCNEQQTIEEPVVTALTPNGFNYSAEISELELQAEALWSS